MVHSIQFNMNACNRNPKPLQDHLTGSKFGPKTNLYQNSNTTLDCIIPLEGNPSNKLKEPHCLMKCLSECSILHWNHIHPCPYFSPLFSGHNSDRHKNPSQDRVVYEEESKLGYFDTVWSLSSDSISNNSPSEAISRATLT